MRIHRFKRERSKVKSIHAIEPCTPWQYGLRYLFNSGGGISTCSFVFVKPCIRRHYTNAFEKHTMSQRGTSACLFSSPCVPTMVLRRKHDYARNFLGFHLIFLGLVKQSTMLLSFVAAAAAAARAPHQRLLFQRRVL